MWFKDPISRFSDKIPLNFILQLTLLFRYKLLTSYNKISFNNCKLFLIDLSIWKCENLGKWKKKLDTVYYLVPHFNWWKKLSFNEKFHFFFQRCQWNELIIYKTLFKRNFFKYKFVIAKNILNSFFDKFNDLSVKLISI